MGETITKKKKEAGVALVLSIIALALSVLFAGLIAVLFAMSFAALAVTFSVAGLIMASIAFSYTKRRCASGTGEKKMRIALILSRIALIVSLVSLGLALIVLLVWLILYCVGNSESFKEDFILNFIDKDRWVSLLIGLKNTIIITLCAALMGVVIGVAVAAVRTTYDNNVESMRYQKSLGYYYLKFFNSVCKVYLTIIRGTPVVVQLLIIYFIILASSTNDILIAIIAFGINSGAYVAEILRGGIMSIDKGQFEAGRSIGFNYVQTMFYIIIPQVFKNVLPTLLNEFIALLKETSIAGYVGVMDLTRAANSIRGATFSAFMPLIALALIYLVIVLLMTKLVGIVERRLRKSER